MRRRSQRLERLRFREWDHRAFDASRSMLERLPLSRPAAAAGDADWLRARVREVVSGGGPLPSPLAFFQMEVAGEALALTRIVPAGEEASGSAVPLASLRRVAEGRYAVEPAA